MTILKELLFDDIKPNHLTEVEWLMDYMNMGNQKGELIFLSLGETWKNTPRQLIECLHKAPPSGHGYQLSMYGLPALRQKFKDLLAAEYRLEPHWSNDGLYEISVCQNGTRSVMFDFASWLKEKYVQNRKPVLITTGPGWDYCGVFGSFGFETQYLPLEASNGFRPDIHALVKMLESATDDLSVAPVFCLNTQHNPTGVNWSPSEVNAILEVLLNRNIPVLLDDAYFAIHEPSVTPTCSLNLLLEKISRGHLKKYPWLMVRSFGKQFSCNGWGIGVVAAAPHILDELVNSYQIRHHYNIGGHNQLAMLAWLNMPESSEYIKTRNIDISSNRRLFINGLVNRLGLDKAKLIEADCTNFQLFPLPNRYIQSGANAFIKDCLFNAGVLFTDAWPLPYNSGTGFLPLPYARTFLGVDALQIEETIARLENNRIFFN